MTRIPPDWPGWDTDPDADRLSSLATRLAALDGPADESGAWPAALWSEVVESGAASWALPADPSRRPDRPTLMRRYARVAEGSLTAAFILSQHDAAVRRLAAASGNEEARRWLDLIEGGRAFATVGLSQLTTSRRHGPAALQARRIDGGYCLDGAMPWVTGAERADVFVAGALDEDGQQLLLVLPADRKGVAVDPAFPLAALQASRTAEVRCEVAEIRDSEILAGPSTDVMATPGNAGTGGLETSALALGQARAALASLAVLAEGRDELGEPFEALADEWLSLASRLLLAAEGSPEAPAPGVIRGEVNAFVLRATQANLTARKGSGFLRTDPAQRLARQALFFLVWSCPSPVANAAIRDLAGLCDA